jgi:hypothetical protein
MKTKNGIVNYSYGEYNGQYLVNNVCPDGKVIQKIIKHGKGTMKYKNGDFYEGYWKDGYQSVKGIMKYANGDVYDGEWNNGYQSGKGIMRYANGDIYEGEWFANREFGMGITRYANGDVYSGQLIFVYSTRKEDIILRSIRERPNGYHRYDDGTTRNRNGKVMNVKLLPGEGTMFYANGDVYTGEWINNLRDGYGTMSYKNGDVYVGKWQKNVRHGYGTMSYKNGDIYEGEWLNNKKKISKKRNFTKRNKSSNSKTKSKKDKIMN